jgi:hypothetical protein
MRQVLIDRTSRIDAIDLWAISPAPSASRVLASDCRLDSGVVSLVSSSARVVYAALAGDLAGAAAKFGASALSGSTAMLTEAIHSLVDSADQLLLLTRCNDAERCYRDSNDRGEILQECSIKDLDLGRLDEGPQGDVSSPDNPFVFAEADGKGPTFEQCGYHQHLPD